MSHRSSSFAVVLILGAPLLACPVGSRHAQRSADGVVFRVPNEDVGGFVAAADSTLFLSTNRALYRNKNQSTRWERIPLPPGRPPIKLYAPSAGDVFALVDDCATVARWRERTGWSEAVLPEPIAAIQQRVGCQTALDIWGRDSSDVYLVGSGGLIGHFDGQKWNQESNPLQVNDSAMDPLERKLVSVSGDSNATYAVSYSKLLVREAGVWRNYEPRPDTTLVECFMRTVAVSQGHPVVGGIKPCMAISDGQRWHDVAQVRGFYDGLLYARPQPDSTLLFWNRDGQLVELRRGSPIVYRTRALKFVRGAASRGGFVYVAGDYTEPGATIVRIPRSAVIK